jgi:hypothetical protein
MTAGYDPRLPFACLLLAAASVAAPVIAPASADAQEVPEGLKLSGNIRLRYEAIDNQPRAGFDRKDDLTNVRTQVRLSWRQGPVALMAEVHDSRAYGADPGTPLSTGEVNALEPAQVYLQAQLGSVLGRGTRTSVQAGRFTLELGSRRLVANDDYRNTTNTFLGTRVDIATASGIKATGLYVLPERRLPEDAAGLRDNKVVLDRAGFTTVLWGGVLARQAKASRTLVETSFLHLGERDGRNRPTRDRSLNTLGARIQADPAPGRWDGGAEAMYQWGRISASLAPTAARLPVSATFLRAYAGYSFLGAWKPHLLFELDRASGDGTGRTYGRFDTLYGMRRADLGPAGLYNAIGRANIVSPGARIEVTPSPRADAFLGYRGLWLADRHDAFSSTGVRDPAGRSGTFAGHQIDARVRYWLAPKRLRFEVDGVYLARGRFLRDAPNGGGGDVRYTSVNLTGFF